MKLSSKYVLKVKVHLTDDFVSLYVIQIVAKVEQDLIGSSRCMVTAVELDCWSESSRIDRQALFIQVM